MGKFKKEKELARTVREELEQKEEQKKLHKKHEQIAEDVVIVEKQEASASVLQYCFVSWQSLV